MHNLCWLKSEKNKRKGMKKRGKSGGGGREERTVREWRREGRSREGGVKTDVSLP